MSFENLLAEDRRLVVLRVLAGDADRRANENVLKRALKHVGHDVSRDRLRTDLAWLAGQLLIRIDRLPDGSGGEMQVAVVTEEGEDVAGGRTHPGVARPPAR